MDLHPDIAAVFRDYPRIYFACHRRHVRDDVSGKRVSTKQVSILDHLDSETPTMLSMIAFSKGWEQTKDPNYQTAMVKLTNWALQYNYQGTAQSDVAYAARVAIGLASVIPDLQDPNLQTSAKKRL